MTTQHKQYLAWFLVISQHAITKFASGPITNHYGKLLRDRLRYRYTFQPATTVPTPVRRSARIFHTTKKGYSKYFTDLPYFQPAMFHSSVSSFPSLSSSNRSTSLSPSSPGGSSTVAPVRPGVYYISASERWHLSERWHRGCLEKTRTK